MPVKNLYLGIDIGTSGIRAIVINQQKEIIANAQQTLASPVSISNNGIEQEPNIWWHALIDVIHSLGAQTSLTEIKSLAIDGTSGTVLVADKNGAPLAPALMYNDGRATEQVAQLAQVAPATAPVHQTSAGLPKLMWLHAQAFAKNIRYALHQADWIIGNLTGNCSASDSNNCLKSGCDPATNEWPDWIAKTNIPKTHLPNINKPGSLIGTILPNIAQQLGLPDSTQIISGTTDSTAALIATGANQTGDAVTSLGSTLVVKIIHDQPVNNRESGIYSQPYYIDGKMKWLVGGASNSGGAVLRQYFSAAQIASLSEQIDISQACNLNYYPLTRPGERFPVNDPDKQPELSPRPDDDAEFLYGLFDGIANIEKKGYELLAATGTAYPKRVFSVGGGSVNSVWTNIRQNKLNCKMLTPEHTDAAYGSALLAMHGYTT